MTFSILAYDSNTGAMGAAAATGSYCVGGWVLRGRYGAGMSASQGAAPSVYWGENVLSLMEKGQPAQIAVDEVTSPDQGKEFRQLSALDIKGRTACFTGNQNTDECAQIEFENGVACGNMLANGEVIQRLVDGFHKKANFERSLIGALSNAEKAGGDFRGLKSAALLVIYPDAPPLSLRIDRDNRPIEALSELFENATSGEYADWLPNVPNPSDPYRFPQ